MDCMVGCDPELFVKNSKGKLLSAWGLVPGDKRNPYKVGNGAVQVDGMALEFNITPAATSGQFITHINDVMRWLRDEISISHNLQLEITPVAHFDQDVMDKAPDKAKELGCTPDFNAWTGEQNPSPDGSSNMRTAAGHIHVGFCANRNPHDMRHFNSCRELIKQLDYYLGVPSILLDQDGEERRKMYGKAGAFRPKPYGVEYRPLSNFWIKSNQLMKWAFNNTTEAFSLLSEKGVNLSMMYGEVAREIIDGNKKDDAIALCKELKIAYEV